MPQTDEYVEIEFSDEEWGSTNDEVEDEPTNTQGEASSGAYAKPQFAGEGLAAAGLGKLIDLGIGLAKMQRKITIKVVNRSVQDLTNPYWSLRDGVTEVNPELTIFGVGRTNSFTADEPGTGEATFRGKTLKGSLSYQIGDTPFAVVILFKVLFFQPEVRLGRFVHYDSRNNQVFVTVIPKNKREKREVTKETQRKVKKMKVRKRVAPFYKPNEDKSKEFRPLRQPDLYDKYEGDLKHCAGKYHEYEVDQFADELNGCPKLKFRYSISDVGDAEIRVICQ